jgi:hypothetical protein
MTFLDAAIIGSQGLAVLPALAVASAIAFGCCFRFAARWQPTSHSCWPFRRSSGRRLELVSAAERGLGLFVPTSPAIWPAPGAGVVAT